MIKYLGSKKKLLGDIARAVQTAAPSGRVLDVFSGTARVGHHLKQLGYQVYANDHNAYAHALAQCYVAADREDVVADAERLLRELNTLPGAPGYFTATYCERARYLRPENGARIDAIRDRIAALALPEPLQSVLLVSLMEAADRVDSTTGVQMAYLKDWAPRAYQSLELRMPAVLPRSPGGRGAAFCMDAAQFVREHTADVVYLDPPYNQHSYLGNYHVWETLVRWDRPEVYGVACKRVDCRERKSRFNLRSECVAAFEQLLRGVDAPTLVVSLSNEGYVSRAQLLELLAGRGEIAVVEIDYKRYVGAQIGIHNPAGERVGSVSHLRNKELLFVAGRGAERLLDAPSSAQRPEPA